MYSDYFKKYASNTNGKKLIAKNLGKILQELKIISLLDVGAGSGDILFGVMDKLKYAVAVEPKLALSSIIEQRGLKNIEIIQDVIQNFNSAKKFGCILLSYFLDTVKKEEWNIILDKVNLMKDSNGIILGATYLEGCEWDVFTQYIKRNIDIPRSGGFGRITYQLREIGWDVRVRKIIDTEIFGENISELYNNLEFFYKSKVDVYRENKEHFIPQLELLSGTTGRANITVKEVIYELLKF